MKFHKEEIMEMLIFILMFVVPTMIFKKIFVALFGGICFVETRHEKEHTCDVCGYPLFCLTSSDTLQFELNDVLGCS